MTTRHRTSTTKMEVTSIRLEPELKERLKELSGDLGYQSLIRDVLWEYVQERGQNGSRGLAAEDIRASFAATARREECCALTGAPIAPLQQMWLGLTVAGDLVPLSIESLLG
ncbi:ribbon-helix-helix domain-containing protein [Rubidibacter lacunae]|uniref:ribbon-helix-helix domain-containing protein n=1 Tax=Rubidibacter lacunae TaxID=582514 RepID=UPI0005907891|nr:ribbon-helix-helix domain-containing protein [Rubidibacter lacunae]